MNRLQKMQFNILKEFSEACQKLNLKYYLVCGSALGAVKYKGFIPWDDDIDVALPRSDYEIFIKEAPALLPENLFVQNYMTDSEFPQMYTKIRNINTTFVEKSVKNINMAHGIFIDVFPLDGYPKNKIKANVIEFKKKVLLKILYSDLSIYRSGINKIINPAFLVVKKCFGNKCIAKLLDKSLSAYSEKTSYIWCNHGNWQGRLDYCPAFYFGEGKIVEFEGIQVLVPEKYDEYLTQKYGDWRQDLPEEEKRGHHYYEKINFENADY